MRWPRPVAAALVLALVPVAASPAASAARPEPRPEPRPVLTQVAPASGSTAGGYDVVLRGKHLTGVKKVTFDGARATGVRPKNARRLVVTAPAHAAGTVAVRVVTKAGASKPVDFTYAAPPAPPAPAPAPPTLARLSPGAGPTAGGDLVTLTGTQLARTGEVRFGGTAASVVSVSDGAVTVRTPSRPPGVVTVTATTPDGTATLQDAYAFLARPSLTSVTPGSGPLAGTRVTLAGSGFTADTRVTFGTAPAGDVRVDGDGRQLTAQAPAAAGPGPVQVTVTTPGGSDTLLGGFRYVAGVGVTAVVPGAGPSAGGTTVRVLGSGFTGSTLVVFGDAPSPQVRPDLDGTALSAVVPAHAAGAVDVLVATAGGSATLTGGFTFVDAPTLTSLTPAAGPASGGTVVSLSGTGFRTGMTVSLGGTAATVLSVDPAGTAATVRAPAHAAGPVDVLVTTPGGTASLVGAFTYVVAPALTAVAPSEGPVAGGQRVSLTGSGFREGMQVTFGGVPATGLLVASPSSASVLSPARAAGPVGPVAVAVVTPGGTASLAGAYTYVDAPVLSAVAPSTGPVGGGTLVTLTGSGFREGMEVRFGGTPAAVVGVSPGSATVLSPARAAGPVPVAVETPGGTASLAGAFTYLDGPSLTAVSPSAGPTAGGTSVTLSGSGFRPGMTVRFGGAIASLVSVDSGSSATVLAPARPPGVVDVSLVTPGGSASLPGGYEYVVAPELSAVSPATGPAAGGASVTLSGSGFRAGMAVRFGGAVASVVSVNAAGTTAVVTTAASVPGVVDVTVSTVGGSATAAGSYEYVAAPTITGVSPGAGPSVGGASVTVTGTGFRPGMQVRFGGDLASVTSTTSTSAAVTTPAHAAGVVDVSVVTTGGSATAAAAYEYVVAPTITGVSLSAGLTAGGDLVTVTGTGFRAGMQVWFGGDLASVTSSTSTSAAVTTPAHAAGVVDVSVATAGGSATAGSAYEYVAGPTITGVSPNAGPTAGGDTVTLSGTGFRPGMQVRFGGDLASVTSSTSTSAVVTTPAHAAGVVHVSVSTAGGSATAGSAYEYAAAPTVTGVAPSAGPTAGGDLVTLTGTGFRPGMQVRFGGDLATVTASSVTSATVSTPAQAAGVVDVSVATAGGSATATGAYEYVAAPTITSVSPSVGPTAGGDSVTLTGTGFRPGMQVRFGGDLATVTASSTTSATVTTPAHAAGAVDVSVATAGGAATATGAYEYAATPTITSVAPNAGPTAGGDTVTLTGTGFRPGMQVRFGSDLATVTASSTTSATVTTPAHAAGAVDVSVATAGGSATAAGSYAYLDRPTITSVTPMVGTSTGGDTVTLTGSGFRDGMQVRFGDTDATTTVLSPTQAAIRTPAHAPGFVDVEVSTPGGRAVVGDAYLYLP